MNPLRTLAGLLGLIKIRPGEEYSDAPDFLNPWPELEKRLHVFVVDVKRGQILYRVGGKDGPLSQAGRGVFATVYSRRIARHEDVLPP